MLILMLWPVPCNQLIITPQLMLIKYQHEHRHLNSTAALKACYIVDLCICVSIRVCRSAQMLCACLQRPFHEMNSLYTSRRDVAQIVVPHTSFFPFLTSLMINFILSSIGVDLTLCVEAGFFQLSFLFPNTLLFTEKQ